MSLLTRDYDYGLPEQLIARRPLARREASRMMVVHRVEQRIEHRAFVDFPGFVRAEDLVVLNNTRVIPARVCSDDGKIELLFLEPDARRANTWKCMVKPGRRMRLDNVVTLGGIEGRVVSITESGERVIAFTAPVDLEKIGQMPIPPYLGRDTEAQDAERYQTVFAQA